MAEGFSCRIFTLHRIPTQVPSLGHTEMGLLALLGGPGCFEERQLGGTSRLSLFILQYNPVNVASKPWAFISFVMKNN